MSKKKAGGSKASQHIRPDGKRLGVKVAHGQEVTSGSVLVRQRGTKFKAGTNVKVGRDHTLFAVQNGRVKIDDKKGDKFISITA